MRRAVLFAILLAGCATHPASEPAAPYVETPYVEVLGIAQDGGYPQAGCTRTDCLEAWRDPSKRRLVASLAIVDPLSRELWIVDATPDFPAQWQRLGARPLTGILLTHAHIGHYLGLAHLGREVVGARGVAVHAMPKMREFLERNGPWDQLVRLGNIKLMPLEDGRATRLNERISVTPLRVPHRDEYSEAVAFVIRGPRRAVLWLPDIDKWEKWQTPLESVLAEVDVAYLDGTFLSASELPGRDLREIPHPTIGETLTRIAPLPESERRKVRFIHLNQSNPALRDRKARQGFVVAEEGEREGL